MIFSPEISPSPIVKHRQPATFRLRNLFGATLLPMLALLAVPLPPNLAHAADPFWGTWSDGKAELNGYELTQPRYGEPRPGYAVLIYVTEPFSKSKLVKVNQYDSTDPDQFVALKLNYIKKFQTGIYDYSTMTSTFVDPDAQFRPLKIAFSSQEWCGQVYQELSFPGATVRSFVRSYFEGETSSQTMKLDGSFDSWDALFIRLRNLRGLDLSKKSSSLHLLDTLFDLRLLHRKLEARKTRIRWSPKISVTVVPAGSFEVRDVEVSSEGGRDCTFQIELAYPHKIVTWRCRDGEEAKLTGSARIAYWDAKKKRDKTLLKRLGIPPLAPAPTQ